ncbi:hypothetical protein H6776_01720 [Candidatus Nomurabacteria bacterium]|nr:hypothetical protein [Candidatus Nomurabacteria bacterium]
MENLAKIFDSSARVKIMRLFLFNPETPYDTNDIAERSKVSTSTARRELSILLKTGFLKKKIFTKEVMLKPRTKAQKKNPTIKKKKANGFILDEKFPLVKPLESLLIDNELVKTKDLYKRFKGNGSIKMLVLSGIFMKDTDRSTDMMVVGDKMDLKKLDRTIRILESEIGKELRYTVFTPEEFAYRMEMYDQHLLDVFEYPHERVVDKIGVTL